MFFKRWRKFDRDGADITLSGRLFQMGPATGKARPLTVDSFADGTSRRLVRAERRERRPGRSATRTSWLRYDGAVPWVALYMSTAVLNRTLSWARSQWRLMSGSKMWSPLSIAWLSRIRDCSVERKEYSQCNLVNLRSYASFRRAHSIRSRISYSAPDVVPLGHLEYAPFSRRLFLPNMCIHNAEVHNVSHRRRRSTRRRP